ncbi:zinc finger protein 620-like isoform X2 [Pleurodeles waltl]|uniref:zinc finger protein 620-like isoform X2 n=1 Tax=Pleurodeles waltl TaxID=8319 RepID=UPI003709826B
MKNRKNAPQQSSDQAPVTFCEVVACFSEEEWKLLQDWQKELYNNVMKEINQALISLGPLIAASVFSLRPKEKEAMCLKDSLESAVRGTITVEPDVSLGKSRNTNQCSKDTSKTDQIDSLGETMTGYQVLNPDNSLKMEQELEFGLVDPYVAEETANISPCPSFGQEDMKSVLSCTVKEDQEMYCINQSNSERRGTLTQTTRFPFNTAEEKASLREYRSAAKEESSSFNTGTNVAAPMTSIGINEEGETYPIDIQNYRRQEIFNSPPGEQVLKVQSGNGDVEKCAAKKTHCKASSKKARVKVIHISENYTNYRRHLWSTVNWKRRAENTTQYANDSMSDTYTSVQEAASTAQKPDTNNESESDLWNAQIFTSQESEQYPCGFYIPSEGKRRLAPNIRATECPTTPIKASLKERRFQCTLCGRNFNQKGHLNRHQRTHTGERPYHCTECNRRFSHNHSLLRHQRIHSGESPYQCEVCLKYFKWKEGLLRHQRSHIDQNNKDPIYEPQSVPAMEIPSIQIKQKS